MIFLVKYWKHIALIAIAVGAFLWLQRHDATIRQTERTACVAAQAQSDIKGVKTNDRINRAVSRLADPDLDRELIDHWLR